MVIFIDLLPCLFTTKLCKAQLSKWGHSNLLVWYSQCKPIQPSEQVHLPSVWSQSKFLLPFWWQWHSENVQKSPSNPSLQFLSSNLHLPVDLSQRFPSLAPWHLQSAIIFGEFFHIFVYLKKGLCPVLLWVQSRFGTGQKYFGMIEKCPSEFCFLIFSKSTWGPKIFGQIQDKIGPIEEWGIIHLHWVLT